MKKRMTGFSLLFVAAGFAISETQPVFAGSVFAVRTSTAEQMRLYS